MRRAERASNEIMKRSSAPIRPLYIYSVASLCLLLALTAGRTARAQQQTQDKPPSTEPPIMRSHEHATPQHEPGKYSGTLRIAAAADLQPLLPGLAEQFEKATGMEVVASFASSSTLATQIINGAPFDLFLAADYTYPEQVVAKGLADTGGPIPYATGAVALWARKDSPLQPISMDTLSSPALKKIAIANPDHAPYGRAAYSALVKLNLIMPLQPKLVFAENIAQTAQFAESGNADAALISLTLASSAHLRALGTYVLVPKQAYPEIRQCAVVMKASKQTKAAHAFLDWLQTEAIQKQLNAQGLDAAH